MSYQKKPTFINWTSDPDSDYLVRTSDGKKVLKDDAEVELKKRTNNLTKPWDNLFIEKMLNEMVDGTDNLYENDLPF